MKIQSFLLVMLTSSIALGSAPQQQATQQQVVSAAAAAAHNSTSAAPAISSAQAAANAFAKYTANNASSSSSSSSAAAAAANSSASPATVPALLSSSAAVATTSKNEKEQAASSSSSSSSSAAAAAAHSSAYSLSSLEAEALAARHAHLGVYPGSRVSTVDTAGYDYWNDEAPRREVAADNWDVVGAVGYNPHLWTQDATAHEFTTVTKELADGIDTYMVGKCQHIQSQYSLLKVERNGLSYNVYERYGKNQKRYLTSIDRKKYMVDESNPRHLIFEPCNKTIIVIAARKK